MITSLFPYAAPTYIVIPESQFTKTECEELENRLSIVKAKLKTLRDTEKELVALKEELNEKIKEIKNSK